MDHFDLDELRQLVKALHQGDVLDVTKTVRLYSPDAPSHPREVENVAHEESVMTMENRLSSGLSVIISQDCDLRRMPDIEPMVSLAPLTSVPQTIYRAAEDTMSARHFAYPPIPGHRDQQHLVVDMRIVSSLEKPALLSSHIKRIECPLTEARREDLRLWLGDRFSPRTRPIQISYFSNGARTAYDDDPKTLQYPDQTSLHVISWTS